MVRVLVDSRLADDKVGTTDLLPEHARESTD
jgi:hypothetical protein